MSADASFDGFAELDALHHSHLPSQPLPATTMQTPTSSSSSTCLAPSLPLHHHAPEKRLSYSFSDGSSATPSTIAASASQSSSKMPSRRSYGGLAHRTSPLINGPYAYATSVGGETRSTPMAARRFASSPLAGPSPSSSSSSFARLMQSGTRSPPQHFSPSTSSSSVWSTSPNARFLPRSPTSPSNARRLSGGGGGVAALKSRRRFSEQSYNGGCSGSLAGGLLTSGSSGSFVGSYEESLLNGRMSSVPSKPLTFDAELGVLGLGKCKASLKCPPHINLKFPAHFYDFDGASANMEGKVSPSSPYVGTIDVESHYLDQIFTSGMEGMQMDDNDDEDEDDACASDAWRRPYRSHPMRLTEHTRKKANAIPSFPGYRVPPKGQVQLVIKNQNLTAVKVFLVPYDLTNMPAGKKTFVRQKCHVAVPLPAASSPMNTTTARGSPRAARETLRYAVHLQFCAVAAPKKSAAGKPGFDGDQRLQSTSNGSSVPRYYLHKSIRVVFTARMPDKSERLTNTLETPRDANGDGVYSTFTGPGEEWIVARRMAKERATRLAHVVMKAHTRTSRMRLDDNRDVVADEAAFDQTMANSDPNGERWVQPTTPDDVVVPMDVESYQDTQEQQHDAAAVEIPLQRTQSWLSSSRNDVGAADMLSISRPMSASHVGAAQQQQSAAFSRSLSRARAPSIEAVRYSSSRPSTPVHHTFTTSEHASEDRALLQQWHASLASRSLQLQQQHAAAPRPSSPTMLRSRPTSPPSMSTAVSLATATSSLQMHRSFSNASNGASGTSSDFAYVSSMRPSSAMRSTESLLASSSASVSPHVPSHVALSSFSHGVPSPKLSKASIDVEHVNGVLLTGPEQADVSMQLQKQHQQGGFDGVIRAPPMLRRLSSQASISQAQVLSEQGTTNNVASSSSSSSSSHSGSIFTWRQTPHVRSSSSDVGQS